MHLCYRANNTLHTNLHIGFIQAAIKYRYKTFHSKVQNHHNELTLKLSVQSLPQNNPCRFHS